MGLSETIISIVELSAMDSSVGNSSMVFSIVGLSHND